MNTNFNIEMIECSTFEEINHLSDILYDMMIKANLKPSGKSLTIKFLNDPLYQYWIAKDQYGKICASLSLYPCIHIPEVIFMNDVCRLPDNRYIGSGAKLIKTIINMLKSKNIYKYLVIRPNNYPKLINYYKSLGFEFTKSYSSDDDLMQYKLT